MTFKNFIYVGCVLGLGGLSVVHFVLYDSSTENKEVNASSESYDFSLSEEADYPTPIIQLQQVLAVSLTPPPRSVSASSNMTAPSSTETIDALRQRLNKLKNDNN